MFVREVSVEVSVEESGLWGGLTVEHGKRVGCGKVDGR